MADAFISGEGEGQGSVGLDFKRVLFRAIRYWYVIILFLAVALSTAFYKNRYSQRVYPISASIIIREKEETTGSAELLFTNALINPYRNYLNEPYILKSYPLIEEVVKELNFDVVFEREGYFMTTEAYDYLPVTASLCNSDEVGSADFLFEIIDDGHFSLSNINNDSEKKFSFGDTITFNNFRFCINRLDGKEIKDYLNVPFFMKVLDISSVTAAYVGKLGVKWAEEGAGLMNLSVSGVTPKKEIDFINGLIRHYQELDLNKKNQTADSTMAFISTQLLKISDSLKIVERQLDNFGSRSRLSTMGDEAQRLFTKLEALEIQKTELLIRANYFKYLDEYIGTAKNLDQIILPSGIGVKDDILTSLISNMVNMQLEMKLYLDHEKKENPLISTKLAKINEVKRDIVESIKSLKETDAIKMKFLSQQIVAAEKQMGYLPVAERQLISIQRNYSLLENLYVLLMQKLTEAGISKASNSSDILLVNPPMRGGAISPKPSQNYTVALIMGLGIPFLLFVVIELLNNKIQSKEDVERLSTIPFVGGVGHNVSDNNLIVSLKPKSGVAESFRALRSNLNYFTGNEGKKVFMVSSSISGEGKTFTTINLATVFALSGKKTLIVGADMRRPKIFQDFNCSNDVGLSTYLSRLTDFKSSIQKTEIENLWLASGGPVPPNPSELLLTERFDQFIKESLAEFDYVLIDTPPLALGYRCVCYVESSGSHGFCGATELHTQRVYQKH
jgi:capsular exopolysaccharide synthesis family protein